MAPAARSPSTRAGLPPSARATSTRFPRTRPPISRTRASAPTPVRGTITSPGSSRAVAAPAAANGTPGAPCSASRRRAAFGDATTIRSACRSRKTEAMRAVSGPSSNAMHGMRSGTAPRSRNRSSSSGASSAARVTRTRAAEDAPELEDLLRERGAVPLRMPCIAFEDGPDTARIASVLRERQADLIVVASPNAARRLLALHGAPGVPFAAAGAATARELPGDVIVPRTGVGADALVREIGGRVRGKRVLVARAEGGNPALVEGLRAAGAIVEACTLYRTVTAKKADPEALRALREGQGDAIAVASGSAARGVAAP